MRFVDGNNGRYNSYPGWGGRENRGNQCPLFKFIGIASGKLLPFKGGDEWRPERSYPAKPGHPKKDTLAFRSGSVINKILYLNE